MNNLNTTSASVAKQEKATKWLIAFHQYVLDLDSTVTAQLAAYDHQLSMTTPKALQAAKVLNLTPAFPFNWKQVGAPNSILNAETQAEQVLVNLETLASDQVSLKTLYRSHPLFQLLSLILLRSQANEVLSRFKTSIWWIRGHEAARFDQTSQELIHEFEYFLSHTNQGQEFQGDQMAIRDVFHGCFTRERTPESLAQIFEETFVALFEFARNDLAAVDRRLDKFSYGPLELAWEGHLPMDCPAVERVQEELDDLLDEKARFESIINDQVFLDFYWFSKCVDHGISHAETDLLRVFEWVLESWKKDGTVNSENTSITAQDIFNAWFN